MSKTKIQWTERTWNPVPNFEGYYASADGFILSKRSHQPRVMIQMKQKDGHLYVYLYDGFGNQKKMYVHRLVLMSWIGMPKEGQECRHLNDDPSDNRLENLAWGTRLENVEDKRRNGGLTIGERSGSHKLTEIQVMEIRQRYSDGKSARDLSVEYNVSHKAILEAVRGDTWGHLPKIAVKVKHSSAQKTKLYGEAKEKWRKNVRKAVLKSYDGRRAERKLVECACGCGKFIETPDKRGRKRMYIFGHFNYWKYRKNEQNKN